MTKKLLLMIVCVLPLLASAQRNLNREDRSLPKSLLTGKKPNKPNATLRATNGTVLLLDSTIVREASGNYLYKAEWQYDDRGNRILEISYDWDEETNDWIESWKYEYQYDDRGNPIWEIDYYWDAAANDWILYGKSENQFDDRGYTILKIYYYWDEETNNWILYGKYEYQYDDRGNLILIEYYWDAAANDWILYGKSEDQFDDRGYTILKIYYYWDEATNDWIVRWKYKYEYQYDDWGNPILRIGYDWDAAANGWKRSSKFEIQWDENGFFAVENSYRWNGSDWVLEYITAAYFSAHTITGIAPVPGKPAAIRLYPNPAVDKTVIAGAEKAAVTVTDMSGRTLYRQTNIGNEENISVSAWNKGIYLITIERENNKQTRKLIKK